MVSACLAWLSWVGGVTGGRFRLAEVVAVLAMAADPGLGLPMEHAVRACLLSTEIGRRAGLPGEELSDLYYLTLLRMLGCTADSGTTRTCSGTRWRSPVTPSTLTTAIRPFHALDCRQVVN